MILPSLRNLRTTVRRIQVSTTTPESSTLRSKPPGEPVLGSRQPTNVGSAASATLPQSLRRWFSLGPAISVAAAGVAAIGVTLLSSLTGTATAQSIATQSTFPSSPPARRIAASDAPVRAVSQAGRTVYSNKQQYEAALLAQMRRAQIEQGAPADFADRAFAATQAYLEQTADKSIRPAQSSLVRPQANQVSASPSTYTRQAYSASESSPGTRGNRVKPDRSATVGPPVHVAPNAYSTPPPVRHRQVDYREGAAVAGTGNKAALQDRFAGMFGRNRSTKTEPRMAPMRTLANSATHRDWDRREPQRSIRQSAYQSTSTRDLNTRLVQHEDSVQPMFVPEPRRIPKQSISNQPFVGSSTRSSVRYPNAGRQPQDISQVSLTAPPVSPKLAGPAYASRSDEPQDHFQNFQTRSPQSQPRSLLRGDAGSVSRTPVLEGSRGTMGRTRADQVSVLSQPGFPSNGSSDASQDSTPSNQIQGSGDRGNSFSPTAPPAALPGQAPKLTGADDQDNRIRPMIPLPGRAGPEPMMEQIKPQEDSGSDQDSIENRLRRIEDQNRQEPANGTSDDDDSDRGSMDDDRDKPEQSGLKTCAEYQTQLLGRSIRDIALDISPPASRIRDQYVAISRSWTDRLGNIVATGTMVDLRRGYVIIDTNNGRQKIPYAKLSDADWAAVAKYWQIPELCSVGNTLAPTRNWIPQTVTWKASALCHKPLYFENRQLERYGHSHGPVLQPIQSTAHFFVSLATLPYQTAIHPPTECRYALGYYRPGNCAPWLKDPIPISLDGVRRQALVTTGLAFLP